MICVKLKVAQVEVCIDTMESSAKRLYLQTAHIGNYNLVIELAWAYVGLLGVTSGVESQQLIFI